MSPSSHCQPVCAELLHLWGTALLRPKSPLFLPFQALRGLMVHPSIATTQVATKAPIPRDALPAIETAKRDPWPDRVPCLPILPASRAEEPSGESIAQHFSASDNKNVVPTPVGPYTLIYWIPDCSLLGCQCEHRASRGGSPGCGPSTGGPASEPAPASLWLHQPTLPAATRGAQASQRGRWILVPPGVRAPVFPAQCQRGVSWGNCLCKASPCPRGRPRCCRCVPFGGGPSAVGPGSLPQSLSKNLP